MFMALTPFNGKLYGGIAYYEDNPHYFPDHPDPASGPQVVVLNSSTGQWQQEVAFDEVDSSGAFLYRRVSALQVVDFTTYNLQVLIASLDVGSGALYAQLAPGQWSNLHLPSTSSVRSFTTHTNPITGVEKLYAGSGYQNEPNAVYSGIFNPANPSALVQWDAAPVISGLPDRVMSMAECGGVLFIASKPSIYWLDDKTNTFQVLYTNPHSNKFNGFRALTCGVDPKTGDTQLLTDFEGPEGDIFVIDASLGTATIDLATNEFLAQEWGMPVADSVGDIIAGYFKTTPVTVSGVTELLIGLYALQGAADNTVNDVEQYSAWFLERGSSYSLHEVPLLPFPYQRSGACLNSIRTIAVSPFPEDQGQVLYIGGYDVGNGPPARHNTAWAYKVGLDTALAPYVRQGAVGLSPACTPSSNLTLVAAVLPTSRSVQLGATPTAFATMINAGPADASTCTIAPATSIPASFVFQTTDPTTNALTGTANTPVNIASGAAQSFAIAFTPTAAFAPTDVALTFNCANAPSPAASITGVNTLNLSASTTPVPDIVALAASGDPGYVDIPGATGTGVFAVATVNLGIDATITAAANTGGVNLPVTLTLCETNPSTGACLSAPTPTVTTSIAANATPTFGIFVTGSGRVADSPGVNRIFVTFTDLDGVLRGETSVADRTQ
jgi:hypothetical protein